MGKIHAVSTQGLLLGVILAAIAGYVGGQYIKSGMVKGRTTVDTSQKLTI